MVGSYAASFSVGLRILFAPAGMESSVLPLEPLRVLACARVTLGMGDSGEADVLVTFSGLERDIVRKVGASQSTKPGDVLESLTATNVWRCTRIYPD